VSTAVRPLTDAEARGWWPELELDGSPCMFVRHRIIVLPPRTWDYPVIWDLPLRLTPTDVAWIWRRMAKTGAYPYPPQGDEGWRAS
jgi:hypothetical protein